MKDLFIKNALVLIFSAAIFLINTSAYSAETQPVNPKTPSQIFSEAEAKNQMLKAKWELWKTGTTKTMEVHLNGAYIDINTRTSR